MKCCHKCSYESENDYKYCPLCGEKLKTIKNKQETENFELRPRFVFVYELLPSSFSTWYMLILLFITCYIFCHQWNLESTYVIFLFLILFILKDIKVLFRQFKYRAVKYNISDLGIEYINDSKDQKLFIPYEDIMQIRIKTNLATNLFGYGHILVMGRDNGIYLDYVSNVEKVYEYIKEHLNH